jgi:tetratricopeptide (TPR) repeat protein
MFSFGDGLYSSLWGDGYCSGATAANFRPPWNYDLMNIGYIFATIPTALIFLGTILAVIRFLRQPTALGFLLLGLVFAAAFGLFFMSLRVTSYAQAKAFYAMPALAAFCVLAATGWHWVSARGRFVQWMVTTGFLAWILIVFGAFWISPRQPLTWMMRGVQADQCGRYSEAADHFSKALRLDPGYLPARLRLANVLSAQNHLKEAQQEVEDAAAAFPRRPEPRIELASLFQTKGDDEQALLHLRQALVLAPDTPDIQHQLASCLMRMGRLDEAADAYRQGVSLHPLDYGMLNDLAWLLASSEDARLRNGAEAVCLAERACELTLYRQPILLGTLAAAYAEAERFEEAVATGQKAHDLASALGETAVAEKNAKLIELYQAHQPYHENSKKRPGK